MDIKGENVTLALAFCNKRDSFEKKTAKNILDGRLDARLTRSRPVKHTFCTVYSGTHPRRDIMNGIMDELRALPEHREHEAVASVVNNISEDLGSLTVQRLHSSV
jgi:hypothetical protein